MEKGYKTVLEPAQAEFVEKKSRFIGHIAPVSSEEEALAFIQEKKSKYWDATHNVYAYILREGGVKRFSDDGEPQGTAGIPSLDVLQKAGITDVVTVVTRYFGGTLLGAGGLVRAYSHGVKVALDAAHIMNMRVCCQVELETDYSLYGKITYILPKYPLVVEDTQFGVAVKIILTIAADWYDRFKRELDDLTNATVFPYITVEELFRDIPDK